MYNYNFTKHNKEDFDLISLLGKGKLSKVYLSKKSKKNKLEHIKADLFVVKKIKKKHFNINEINILNDMNHPNIIKFYGSGEDNDHIYLYLEYIEGYSLKEKVKRSGSPIFENQIKEYVADLTLTLYHIHRLGVVHRDIKCENILVDNNSKSIKVIDFGLSKSIKNELAQKDSNQSDALLVVGTLAYLAPEATSFKSKIGPKADIWSLGCTIIEMAGGDLVHTRKKNKITIPQHLSIECKDFLEHCLAKDVKLRYNARSLLEHNFIRELAASKAKLYGITIEDLASYENLTYIKDEPPPEAPNWLINYKDLKFEKCSTIGRGNFGIVKKGYYGQKEVAIKFIKKPNSSINSIKDTFLQEVNNLSKLDHKNIIKMEGACISPYSDSDITHIIVTRFVVGGSLRQFLQHYSSILDNNPQLRMKFALDIAKAMNYMHSYDPPILHRDLTSNNILLDIKKKLAPTQQRYTVDDITCLVSDLGLSANFEESLNYKMGGGFYPYLAPEIWRQDSICTTQSDVYAYGMILCQLFSYCEPHTNLEKKDSVYRLTEFKNMILNGYTPTIPQTADSNWCELIKRCWNNNPDKRPTFAHILQVLEQPNNPLSPNSIEEIMLPIDLKISIDKSNDSNLSSDPYGGYGYVD